MRIYFRLGMFLTREMAVKSWNMIKWSCAPIIHVVVLDERMILRFLMLQMVEVFFTINKCLYCFFSLYTIIRLGCNIVVLNGKKTIWSSFLSMSTCIIKLYDTIKERFRNFLGYGSSSKKLEGFYRWTCCSRPISAWHCH